MCGFGLKLAVQRKWSHLAVLLSSLASELLLFFFADNIDADYGLFFAFPIMYFIFFLFAGSLIGKSDYKYTLVAYSGVQWVRFVLTPAVMAISGTATAEGQEITTALQLLMMEFLVSAALILVLSLRHFERRDNEELTLMGSPRVYLLFALVALGLFLLQLSRGNRLLNFLFIRVNRSGRIGDLVDTADVIPRQIITCAITFTFLVVVKSMKNMYERSHKMRYIIVCLIVAILVVAVIVGERRSTQIYTATCTAFILSRIFAEKKRLIITVVLSVAVVVLFFMSLYKVSYAFAYSSYSDALDNTSFSLKDLSSTLQSYFGGPSNIALSIRFAKANHLGVRNLLFDFGRSIVPLSFLLKNRGTVTSVLFNQYLYFGRQNSGHVISSTAYGYIYGGFVFAPWVMSLNIAFALFFERRLKRTRSMEMSYIWLLLLMRFCLNLYANTPALLSASSIALVAYGLVFLGSTSIKGTRLKRLERRIL